MTDASAAIAAYPAERVVAVVVTYNRRELLLGCLSALRSQTRAPDTIVVVDNLSTDGTAEALAAETVTPGVPIQVLRPERNLGGAGGFAIGMDAALGRLPDWLWLMDDDSTPEPEALARLLDASVAARQAGGDTRRLGFLASRVLWKDGTLHAMNTPGRMARGGPPPVAPGLEAVDYASFVSLLVSTQAVRVCGLPIAEFFLGSDDVEYSWRLRRAGYAGYHVEASRVWHLTATNVGMAAWDPDVTPADVHKWALKIRNLVAVNRRRPWGWLREPVRVFLLPLIWWWRGMAPPNRRRLTRAARDGLVWQYEPLIRFAHQVPDANSAHPPHAA